MAANKLEILEANYWEHYKFLKDVSMFLPLDDPKRVNLEKELSNMLKQINEIKNELKR